MRKTNEASLFSYNGESINEGEQRKAAVAVAVAAVVTVELQTFLMAVELYLCIVNGDVAPTRRPYRKYMTRILNILINTSGFSFKKRPPHEAVSLTGQPVSASRTSCIRARNIS